MAPSGTIASAFLIRWTQIAVLDAAPDRDVTWIGRSFLEATPVVSRLSAPATRGEKPRPPAWMGENVHFKKGYGFEYRRELRMGETPLELGFKGPVVRKKKRLGLTVEVRF